MPWSSPPSPAPPTRPVETVSAPAGASAGSSVTPRHWKHLGLYGYRREALLEYPTLPPGDLERIEQLEQLRWLENGFRIRVVESDYDAVSVDVPADVVRVEELLQVSSPTASGESPLQE